MPRVGILRAALGGAKRWHKAGHSFQRVPLDTRLLFSHSTMPAHAAGKQGVKCWNCDADICSEACTCQCGALQRLSQDKNYYDLFGMSGGVTTVNAEELEKRFKNLQKLFHPDRFGQKTPEEQEVSGANAALVNHAYQTLKDPMSRVKYLLQSLDVNVLEEAGDGGDAVSPELLMEVYEAREALEECSCVEEAGAIVDKYDREIDEVLQQLEADYQANDKVPSPTSVSAYTTSPVTVKQS
ncbi:unnamed protein product [Chrysoparadoxa australica]